MPETEKQKTIKKSAPYSSIIRHGSTKELQSQLFDCFDKRSWHAMILRHACDSFSGYDFACAVPRWRWCSAKMIQLRASFLVECDDLCGVRWKSSTCHQNNPEISSTWFPNSKKISLETLVPKLREYVHRCRAKTGNPRALIVVSHRDILTWNPKKIWRMISWYIFRFSEYGIIWATRS